MEHLERFDKVTRRTRSKYDRAARKYDRMQGFLEKRAFAPWRQKLWSDVDGERILEVGVGTGRNFPYYPAGSKVTAVDLSPGMLGVARAKARESGIDVDLREMDVQHLDLPAATFDAVVATFVFCSVPYPVLGLEEIHRVLTPGRHLYLLEHVLSRRPVIRQGMKAVNPVVVRMHGVNIDRETASNILAAGFAIEWETDLWSDIVKLFVARKPNALPDSRARFSESDRLPPVGPTGE